MIRFWWELFPWLSDDCLLAVLTWWKGRERAIIARASSYVDTNPFIRGTTLKIVIMLYIFQGPISKQHYTVGHSFRLLIFGEYSSVHDNLLSLNFLYLSPREGDYDCSAWVTCLSLLHSVIAKWRRQAIQNKRGCKGPMLIERPICTSSPEWKAIGNRLRYSIALRYYFLKNYTLLENKGHDCLIFHVSQWFIT